LGSALNDTTAGCPASILVASVSAKPAFTLSWSRFVIVMNALEELLDDGKHVRFDGHLVSLGLGTGSAFALLPAQNASGNWIKIVQRVPVRITLDPEQLAQHPLRLGMSMSTDVTIRDQSGPVLPAAVPAKSVLSTQAYARQLHDADALIAKVIRDNLPRRG